MASRGRIRRNSRPTGLIVAGAIALMLAGVVLLVAINSKTRPKSDGNEMPIDISATPPGGGDVVDISAQATGRFQAVDKDDPTRVAWELLFSKLDPIGAGVYRLSEPRAWIYLKDGQTLFVRADNAQIKKPAAIDGQIESGEFVGNTIAMVFPNRAEAAGAIGTSAPAAAVWDPDRDIPWLLARTHSVKFDTVLLELSSESPVKISTREAQFDGATMLVRGNQVRNRLEYMKIGGPGTIRYTLPGDDTGAGSSRDDAAASATESTTAAADAAMNSASAAPSPAVSPNPSAGITTTQATNGATNPAANQPEEFYRAVFSKEVVLVQTGRKLNADMLELWARVIDNKFPDGAFGEATSSASALPTEGATRHTLSDWINHANQRPRADEVKHLRSRLQLVADVSIAAGETLFRPTGDDIVLDWGASGDLAISPLMERPSELVAGNDLLGRFTAAQTGRVKFQDRATGAVGQSGVVEYAATPRVLTLRTDAPRDARRAWVHLPGSGLYTGEQVDVAFSTGKVKMTGGGLLASIRGNDTSPDVFAGIALATPESLEGLSQTRRMTWRERADFQFATRDGVIDDDLEKATFIGSVRAEDDRSTLEAEQMEADFVRASTATADAHAAALTRRTTPTIRVFGAGKFTHALPESSRKSPTDPTTFEVTWTKSMFFDDAPAEAGGDGQDASSGLGRIECDGDAMATGSGPFALDVLRSHRVRVDLGRVTDERAASQDAVVGDRRILRIEAIGASFERDGGKNASIESRRYAPGAAANANKGSTETASATTANSASGEGVIAQAEPPSTPGRRLEQIVYLDGPRIIADDEEGTLRVPSEGRALFVDQRMAETASGVSSTNPASGVATGDLRGTTKFEWKGSMVYRRESGVVNLLDTVEMVHKPMDNQPFARLTCNELEALVGTGAPQGEEGAASGGSDSVSVRAGKLTRATAIGNVYIESQDRKKLVAERATYDAERSIIEASADGANLVSMFDESQAVPMVARKMRWDLAGDRIEITEPAPTTVPR